MSQSEQAYISTKDVFKTIGNYLLKGQAEEAAALYSRCQEDIGYQLISRIPSENVKLKQSLAKMFFVAKDFQKAAQVCEQLQDFKRAAQLYERCDDYFLAAEMYARVENNEKAAEMFERYGDYNQAANLYTKVGNFEKAAQNFEKAINNYLAGKYYFQIGKYQKSMELLQKVSHEESDYLDAAILIGNILAKHGYLDLALRKYQSVIKDSSVNQSNLNVFYNLGILYAKKGSWVESKQTFSDILAVDFNYKDTQQKLSEIQKRMEQPTPVEEPPAAPLPEVDSSVPESDESGAQVVSVMDGFEFMRGTPLFENLSLAEIKSFYNVSEIKEFHEDDIIIEQGVPGEALYIVKKGSVWIQRVSADKAANIVELKPGAHVGEMSLIDSGPTSARVAAAQNETEVFQITREKFDALLRSSDRTALKIYRVFVETLSKRLRDTTQELAALKANG